LPTLYRIAKNNPATLEDFWSEYSMGREPRGLEDLSLLFWFGVSLWATDAQARRKAEKWPVLGGFIAELDVPVSKFIVLRRTLVRGHHTAWALPAQLLGCAIRSFDV
jgi:hypothetical protein